MVSEETDPVDSGAIPKRAGTTRLRERVSDLPLFNKYVGIAVLIQLVGYAALSALIPHSDYSLLVEHSNVSQSCSSGHLLSLLSRRL